MLRKLLHPFDNLIYFLEVFAIKIIFCWDKKFLNKVYDENMGLCSHIVDRLEELAKQPEHSICTAPYNVMQRLVIF